MFLPLCGVLVKWMEFGCGKAMFAFGANRNQSYGVPNVLPFFGGTNRLVGARYWFLYTNGSMFPQPRALQCEWQSPFGPSRKRVGSENVWWWGVLLDGR
jgi:hypothetical protein